MNLGQKALTFLQLARTTVKEDWRSFLAVFWLKIYLGLWIAGQIANWLFTYLLVRNLPQENVNLHYNILFGTDLIGPPFHLYFLPLTGLAIGFFNIILALTWLKKDRLLTYLSINSAVIINAFTSLAIYSNYLINFVNIKF